ncbi:B- and T-lymphocyte attenuator-like [Pyxicephalus adspersus]|uniref:B- and T-lymphocyte attenuator-like n=1 Tax=Pyxicephalus adspersus TaxID=30357 RepID=UPI003B5C9FD5
MSSSTGLWTTCLVFLVISGFVIEIVFSCTPSINIQRNSKFRGAQGQSVSLRCPVYFCSQERPIVTWCKIDAQDFQCNPVKLDHQIVFGWEVITENEAVHVLKFYSVQINDTGFYTCSAEFKMQQIVGSVIKLTISNDTKPKSSIPHTSRTWTMYLSYALKMIIFLWDSALLYHYVREIKANGRLFKRSFTTEVKPQHVTTYTSYRLSTMVVEG